MPTAGGALGRLRHLFIEDTKSTSSTESEGALSRASLPLPTIATSPRDLVPELGQRRQQHTRVRWPRLADQTVGHEEEMHIWEQQALLYSGGTKGRKRARAMYLKFLEENEENEDDGEFSSGASSAQVVLGYGSLATRRCGPPPRPTILPRAPPVEQIAVGTIATFHANPMDDVYSQSASNASLFSDASFLSRPVSSKMGMVSLAGTGMSGFSAGGESRTSWAPSRTPAAPSTGAIDRKWLTRVAPISCLPSQPAARAARRALACKDIEVGSEEAGGSSSSSVSADILKASGGAAGGYLSFENWGLTDDYIEALVEAQESGQPSDSRKMAQGMRDSVEMAGGLAGVHFINLSGNLLTENGLAALVSDVAVAENLGGLNLSSNRLGSGPEAVPLLLKHITKLSRLLELDLGGNSLGDMAVVQLCTHLRQACPHLEGLGLARCNVGAGITSAVSAGSAVGSYMATCATMKCLDLSWNQFGGDGGLALLEGLYENNMTFGSQDGGVRRLSLAWNRLGSGKHPDMLKKQQSARCARQMANIFQDCEPLFHLDLSYNGFDAEDCATMAAGLALNHTLFGLHLVGNEAAMDDSGFIVPLGLGKDFLVPEGVIPGDGSTAAETIMSLNETLQTIPQKLRIGHPIEISGFGAKSFKPTTPSLMWNPGLLAGSSTSEKQANVDIKTPLMMPSASKDRLHAERIWANEQTRVKAIANSLNQEYEELQHTAKCCWVCDNWCEFKVIYTKGKRATADPNAVYALFSSDSFARPTLCKKLGSHWVGHRMLPPSMETVQVVFIVDGVPRSSTAHRQQKLAKPKSVVLNPSVFGFRRASNHSLAGTENLPAESSSAREAQGTAEDELAEKPYVLEVTEVNAVLVGISAMERHRRGEPTALCVLEDSTDRSKIDVRPRAVVTQRNTSIPKEAWSFETSSFKNYQYDAKLKAADVFEADWKLHKVTQLVKDPEAQGKVGNALRSCYMQLALAFWYNSMFDFVSHRHSLGMSFSSWRDILTSSGGEGSGKLLDGVTCLTSDIDCIFVAANVLDNNKKKLLKVMPEKALARFQFAEAYVRLAFKRFLSSPLSSASPEAMAASVQALTSMLKLGEAELVLRRSLQQELFTEECDLVFREYHEHLQRIYDGFKNLEPYPGRRGNNLSFGAWLVICGQLSQEDSSARRFRQAFALGREIHVDETSGSRHMELSWPEFLLCLGAIVRLEPEFDKEFFADQLADLFEKLVPISESLQAGNPATVKIRKRATAQDLALLELVSRIFEEADEDFTGSISRQEFRRHCSKPRVKEDLLKFGVCISDVDMLFKTLDRDGQGELTFDEVSDGFTKISNLMKNNERAVSYLRKAFAQADQDGTATLDKAEFRALFAEPSTKKKMESIGLNGADVGDLFSLIDEDKSGQVTVDEVISGYLRMRDPNTAGERGVVLLSQIFRKADVDKNGSLSREEYLRAFNKEAVEQQLKIRNLKVPDWEPLFGYLDTDNSDSLSWEELSQGLAHYWARAQMEGSVN
eukprot:TRINITY_DN16310_c0_g8_i1.p1 TRINITY_DN16310_c0_g8~~TRINITY_DN16310_c0_g8_i1.p1  ORF type:complete len:1606 (+),score=285.74 TRINITY_DN16310_c0_g8_i1:302-4819(+)